MSLLFYVNDSGSALLHPEVVKLCPQFNAITEQELIYIILFADYNSPLKQFPEHDRRRKAMLQAFGDNERELIESPRITAAVNDYISCQYNPKIETARAYQQKIDRFQQQLLVDESPSSAKKIGDAIDDLTKRIDALHRDYDKEMDKQGVIKGKMELSHLEKIMSNKKMFELVTSKNKK